jgi:hypothetical protein
VPFWTLLFIGLSRGLGTDTNNADDGTSRIIAQVRRKHISSSPTPLTVTQMFSWYQVPRLVCMGLTKCSAAYFIHDLKGHIRGWKIASLASFFTMAWWTAGAPLVAVIGCTSDDANVGLVCLTMVSTASTKQQETANAALTTVQVPRWRVIMISSVCLEVWLVGLAVSIPWMTETLPQNDRLKVSALFLCRLM